MLKLDAAIKYYLIVFLLTGAASLGVFLWSQSVSKENEAWVIHIYEVIEQAEVLTQHIQNAETGQRGYLLTLDSTYLEPYYLGLENTFIDIEALIVKTSDNPNQTQRLGQLKRLVNAKFEELAQTVTMAQAGDVDAALNLVKSNLGQQLMQQIRTNLAAFIKEEQSLLAQRQAIYTSGKTRFRDYMIAALLCTLLAAFLMFNYVHKRVVMPLVGMSKKAHSFSSGKEVYFDAQQGANEIAELAKTLNGMQRNMFDAMQQLEVSNEEALQGAQAKEDFLANMSHEIRTPMNGVLGTMQLLKSEIHSQKGEMILQKGLFSARSLITIINDILDVSKIHAGKLQIEKAPFQLSPIVELLNSDLSPVAEQKQIHFTILNYVSHDYWLGDRVRIQQVLLNLLANAIKFTKEGEVRFVIDVNADGHLHFVIIDTGIGMNKETVSALFERFTQADTSTTRKYGGTGLGMPIARSLTELMGGTITVDSVEGVGTRFEVTLPLPKADKPAQQNSEIEDVKLELSGRTILIAEDNLVNQMIVTEMLKPTGAELIVVENGRLALEAIGKAMPDIVLMDIQMPEMDGVEACSRMLNDHPNLPIVALTANVMVEDIELYKKAGFKDCLGKPLEKQALYRVLAKQMFIERATPNLRSVN